MRYNICDGYDHGDTGQYGGYSIFYAHVMYQYAPDGDHAYDHGCDRDRYADGSSCRGYGVVGVEYDHDQRYADGLGYLYL